MNSDLTIAEEFKVRGKNLIKKGVLKLFPRIAGIIQIVDESNSEIDDALTRHLYENTTTYFSDLFDGSLTNDELEYISNLFNNPISEREEASRIMAILNNSIDSEKCHYLSLITKALAKKRIEFNQFLDYTELLNNIFYYDLMILLNKWSTLDENGVLIVKDNFTSVYRLTNFGIGQQIFDDGKRYKVDNNHERLFRYDDYAQTFINIINDDMTKKSKISDEKFITTQNTSPTYSALSIKYVDEDKK